jgi:hypothetical protein
MRQGLWVLGLLAVTACAPKNREAIEKMKPEYATLRARLAKIGQSIPGTLLPPSLPRLQLSPSPVFGTSDANTDFLSFEQLADVYAKPRLNLNAEGDLVRGLLWTGDHSPAADSMLDRRDGKALEAQLRQALQTRYLVVYRTVGLVEPQVVDEHTFKPGQVVMVLYLVDLANGDKISALAGAVGQTAPSTEYVYKKGEDPKERLAAFAHSTLYESVLKQIREKLALTTGGRYSFQ